MLDEILLDYNIFKEPQKLCVKGNIVLEMDGCTIDARGLTGGIEIMVSDLSEITGIHVEGKRFMTIENRTSYLRYQDNDTTIFYLGGYANRYQRDFIKMVCRDNPGIKYLHFGDIDDRARKYMISPVQKIITVKAEEVALIGLIAGEAALSNVTELNPPIIPEKAIYKGAEIVDQLEAVDARFEEQSSCVKLQLWKYGPEYFAKNGAVDPVSLVCSFIGNEDERIEMCIEELLEERLATFYLQKLI